MAFKPWETKPQRVELQDAVMQFMQHISRGEFGKAFEVCPLFDYDRAELRADGKEVQGDANDPAEIATITDHLFDTLEAYGYFEGLDNTAPIPVKEDVSTWAFHITPPSADSFNEYGLYLFDDDGKEVFEGGGQVDAFTFVRGEVSDITTVFHLKETARGWFLNFKFMKVQ